MADRFSNYTEQHLHYDREAKIRSAIIARRNYAQARIERRIEWRIEKLVGRAELIIAFADFVEKFPGAADKLVEAYNRGELPELTPVIGVVPSAKRAPKCQECEGSSSDSEGDSSDSEGDSSDSEEGCSEVGCSGDPLPPSDAPQELDS